MVEWGKFDTLAHITYPLRYTEGKGKRPATSRIRTSWTRF